MLHLHSILRWAVLALLLIAIIKSILGLIQKKEFSNGDAKIGLNLMIFTHLQLILGLVLYFTQGWAEAPFAESMKMADTRFWKIEHLSLMITAVALITIGRIRTKKITESFRRHRTAVIFYSISLLVILMGIPWDKTRLF